MIGPHVTDLDRRGDAHHELGGGPRRGGRADPPAPVPVRRRSARRTSRSPASRCTPREERSWRPTFRTRRRRAASARCPTTSCATCCYLLKLCRYFDERMEALYRQGRLPGAIYSGRGQEGTHVGVACALAPDDSLFPTHRDLSAQLTKGLDLKRVMAQFWGRIDGYLAGPRRQQPHRRLGRQPHLRGDVPPADRLPGGGGRGVAYQRARRRPGRAGDLRRRRHVERPVARVASTRRPSSACRSCGS